MKIFIENQYFNDIIIEEIDSLDLREQLAPNIDSSVLNWDCRRYSLHSILIFFFRGFHFGAHVVILNLKSRQAGNEATKWCVRLNIYEF